MTQTFTLQKVRTPTFTLVGGEDETDWRGHKTPFEVTAHQSKSRESQSVVGGFASSLTQACVALVVPRRHGNLDAFS